MGVSITSYYLGGGKTFESLIFCRLDTVLSVMTTDQPLHIHYFVKESVKLERLRISTPIFRAQYHG
jgi:hypothetical protein